MIFSPQAITALLIFAARLQSVAAAPHPPVNIDALHIYPRTPEGGEGTLIEKRYQCLYQQPIACTIASECPRPYAGGCSAAGVCYYDC